MLRTRTDPIPTDWSAPATIPATATDKTATDITASHVSSRLARLEVSDIDPAWLPFLAAAAAELASVAGIAWRFSTDDPAVALLRLIAKATITCPNATGPHTGRLMDQLP